MSIWFWIMIVAWSGWALLKWDERRERKRAVQAWREEYESHLERWVDEDGIAWVRWKP